MKIKFRNRSEKSDCIYHFNLDKIVLIFRFIEIEYWNSIS